MPAHYCPWNHPAEALSPLVERPLTGLSLSEQKEGTPACWSMCRLPREVCFPPEMRRLWKMTSFCRSGDKVRSRQQLELLLCDVGNCRDTMGCRDTVSCLDTSGSHRHSALTPYSDDMLDSFSAGNSSITANPPAQTQSLCV